MYHHHIKKEFTKAGQVNPELIFEKMGTVYSQGQCYGDALLGFKGLIAYINTMRGRISRPTRTLRKT